MKWAILIIFIIAIAVVSTIIYTGFINNDGESIPFFSKNQNNKVLPEQNNMPASQDNSQNQIAGGDDSSGGGSAGAQSPSSNPNCQQEQISYSLSNFKTEETCLSEEPCTEKQINCSAIIKNLDYETEGEFTIKFYLTDETEEILDSALISNSVQPRQEALFQNSFTTTQSVEQDLNCETITQSIPKKSVC